jgi:hypothetical protein
VGDVARLCEARGQLVVIGLFRRRDDGRRYLGIGEAVVVELQLVRNDADGAILLELLELRAPRVSICLVFRLSISRSRVGGRVVPLGTISGRSSRHFPPFCARDSSGSGRMGARRFLRASWLRSSSLRQREMSLVLKMRAAAVGTVFWKKARSSTFMARLTGGANMSGADMGWMAGIRIFDRPLLQVHVFQVCDVFNRQRPKVSFCGCDRPVSEARVPHVPTTRITSGRVTCNLESWPIQQQPSSAS